ncbi:hypothetical protein ACET44_08350, partial [Pseudomonas aeruginosa]
IRMPLSDGTVAGVHSDPMAPRNGTVSWGTQGKTEQAATQLAELQKRFPGENLVERLERLATIAASARKRP